MLATQKWEKAANIILQFRKINLFKNQVHFKFSRNRTRSSRTNIENCVGIKVVLTIVCAYQEVKNVCFSKNLTSFVFLKHPFFDSAFYLITDACGEIHFWWKQKSSSGSKILAIFEYHLLSRTVSDLCYTWPNLNVPTIFTRSVEILFNVA